MIHLAPNIWLETTNFFCPSYKTEQGNKLATERQEAAITVIKDRVKVFFEPFIMI